MKLTRREFIKSNAIAAAATTAGMSIPGVALAAIQGLNQKVETAVKDKDARIAELERRLAALERVLKASTQ